MKWYDHGSRKQSRVALTFDDGPNPHFTSRILDVLDHENVPATFFLIGKWVEQFPGVAKEIIGRGYTVGNHSYSHEGDFDLGDQVFFKTLGFSPRFVRFPYGAGNPNTPWLRWWEQSQDFAWSGKQIVNFDVEVEDWKNPGEDAIIGRVITRTKSGSIIVLHDGSERFEELSSRPRQMVQVLTEVIYGVRAKGFFFVALDDLQLVPHCVKEDE